MLVDEIFLSISGESSSTGKPTVFIRLYGCNICCKFCDTPQDEGEYMSEEKIVDHVRDLSRNFHVTRHVVITGGEPMLQPLESLVRQLLTAGVESIQIETNGTKPIPDFYKGVPQVSFVMDIKLPSAGVSKDVTDMCTSHALGMLNCIDLKYWGKKHEIKFVIGSMEDVEVALKILDEYYHTFNKALILFSPVIGEGYDASERQAMVYKLLNSKVLYGLDWRIQLQIHKFIGFK